MKVESGPDGWRVLDDNGLQLACAKSLSQLEDVLDLVENQQRQRQAAPAKPERRLVARPSFLARLTGT